MRYLSNAFSLNMVEGDSAYIISRKIEASVLAHHLSRVTWQSAIGHPSTAPILSDILNIAIPIERRTITLTSGDVLYVAQYKGPRLEDGATRLPNGASIEFFIITIEQPVLADWPNEIQPASIYGSLLARGKEIAEFVGGEAKPMQDCYGNFIVEVNGNGFYGRLLDE